MIRIFSFFIFLNTIYLGLTAFFLCEDSQLETTYIYMYRQQPFGTTEIKFYKRCTDGEGVSYLKGNTEIDLYLTDKQDQKKLFKASSDLFVSDGCDNPNCKYCLNFSTSECVVCKDTEKFSKLMKIANFEQQGLLDCNCQQQGFDRECKCTPEKQYECYEDGGLTLKCFGCPSFVLTCSAPSSKKCTDSPIYKTCLDGDGFLNNPSELQCGCLKGYHIVIDYTLTQHILCIPDCEKPCLKCVDGSNKQCQTCQSNQMIIDSNKNCQCPPKYYMNIDKNLCIQCDYTCATCAQQSTNCITCSSLSNRIYQQGTCPCNQFYYLIPGQEDCQACQWSCATCYDSNSCSTCDNLSKKEVNYLKNNDSYCHCITGYAEDLISDQCKACIETCETCQSTIDTCTSCFLSQNRQLVNSQCKCLEKYFDNKDDPNCSQCHRLCLNCDGENNDNCLSCQILNYRILNDKKECQCKQGYGYDDQNSEQCYECAGICQECDNYQNCILCPSGINRILDQNKCICDIGFYEDQSNLSCLPCHKSCQTCVDQLSCLTCNKDMGRIIDEVNQSCNCSDGYYEFYSICVPCYYTCLKCISQFRDGCTSCPSSRKLEFETNQHSQCLCQSTSQIDDGKSLQCTDCHYSCYTCYGPGINNCLTCKDNQADNSLAINRFLQFDQCTCPNKTYDDQVNENCLKCHNSCQTCFFSDQYSCITCSEVDHRVQLSNSCLLRWVFRKFRNFIICATCEKDRSNCLTCLLGSLRSLVQQTDQIQYKTCQCPQTAPNDVESNPICQTCHFTCKNCFDKGQDQCTICDATSNRVIKTDDTGSYCLCNLSYYEIQTPECAQCSTYCLACNGQANNCTQCNPQQFRVLDVNKCICGTRIGTQYLSYYDNLQDPECVACHYSCYTCNGTEYNQCLTCSDLDFRIMQSNQCACKPKYIDNREGICMTCNLLCETCAGQKDLCTSCPLNSLRTLNIQSQKCDCPLGYFDSGQILCEWSNRTLNEFTNQCECLSGYYDSGNGSCSICHYSCLQCSGPSSNECISCPDFQSTKRSLLSSQCICPDKYYDDSKNQLCQPCSQTCYTCQVNQNQCKECVASQFRILQGQECVCLSSYYESGSSICSKCDNLCQECIINSTTCTKCDSLQFRTLNKGKCECNSGYFDDGTLNCKKCDITCQTCFNNENNCTSCDNSNFRYLDNGKCQCQSGTIDQGSASCFSCDTRCLTCTNINTQCLTCDSTQLRTLVGQQCKCQDGYFENNIKQCIICDQICLTCETSSTTCRSCSQIDNKVLSSSSCICQNGYFSDSSAQCQLCSNKCQTCSTANQCLSCALNSFRTLQGSKCLCNQGYYDLGGSKCFPCDQTCQTCISQHNNCISCDSSLNRILNGSICECKIGYFDNGSQQCQKCDISCVTCIDSATKCKSCDISITFRMDLSKDFMTMEQIFAKNALINAQIVQDLKKIALFVSLTLVTIETIFHPNVIVWMAILMMEYKFICQQCGPKCLTCQNQAQNCLVCESALKRSPSPTCDCKPGYFENQQKKCEICSINCLTCSENSKSCITCQPDRISKECLCQDGYYEAQQITCQLCSHKCSTCLDHSLNCITCAQDRINPPNCVCKEHYYDDYINPQCQECDKYCGKCDMNGCIDCAANRIQNLRTCICPVDSISYSFTPYCSNCDVAVISGIFSDDLSELIYTFEYDLQFNFPTQVDVQAYCQFLIKEKSLKLIGESPKCRIEQKLLIISLGTGASVIVGDLIEFDTEILKHTQCQNPLKLIIKQQLKPPVQLLKPQIMVSYPQVPVSPCASIEIFIQQQFINGQRNLKLVWSSSLQLPAIDIANQLQFQTLNIEQGQVAENQTIEIMITFTNFLDQSDQMMVQFQTLSASVPQFQFKTIKDSYISWVPIKILVYFANTICSSGTTQSLNNPIQISFEEQVSSRTPQNSNAIQFQQQVFNLQEQEGLISTIIPARTLTLNSKYLIISKFQDLQTKQEITAQFSFQIERSPLLVQIIGGSRIQNYLKAFQMQIQTKDPDLQVEWNQDPQILLSVECIDLQNKNQPCIDQFGKTVHLNKTSNIQFIAARLFRPFTVLLFKANCSKENLYSSTSAAIILLDADLPTINVSYPQGYQIRDVNINEKLKFQIIIDKNQKLKDMDFSFALVYNYETVYIRNIPNQIVEFAIWEGFQKFSFINQISVKFQAHNVNYLMPQIASVTLTVNMPPVNSIITISPQQGNAVTTQFTIRVLNSKDKDSPIQYRYAYYESQKLYQKDIMSGKQENIIILQDFSPVQSYKTLLESGNLTIIISVSDSLGSMANYTQQVNSLTFYDQWQLETDNSTNISSKCKQMVSDLLIQSDNIQQLIITSLELIKLLKQNIQQDCIQIIHQHLQKNQQALFEQLLKISNNVLKSRISNVLSKIYELNLEKPSRQLTVQEDSQLCYNTSSNRLQISQLRQIALNESDSDQIINNITEISNQIQKAIQQNIDLVQDSKITQDIGDDQTSRSLLQNIELRKSYIRILGSLFNKVYQQQIVISGLIDKLMDSFQLNLDLDTSGVTLSTQGLGVQVYKIGQKQFEKFIIMQQVDPEDINLSNFIINRYIQLVKYKNNKYFYTDNFKNILNNGSILLHKKETNHSIYEQSVIPYFESYMLDPQIYVDNVNQVTKVQKIYQGKLAFRMGININKCDQTDSLSYDKTKDYQFVCSSFIDEKWVHNSCQIELFTDKKGSISVQCYCDKLYPLTVMIMNNTNTTKTQSSSQKPIINIEDYINILIAENITIHAILFITLIIIGLRILFKVRKYKVKLNLIQERLDSRRQEEPIGFRLTQQPRMSTQLFKDNIKYLHEISRLLFVNYTYLSYKARFILTTININVLLTSLHIFNVIIQNHILSLAVSILISLIFQLVVKVLEGFFDGPNILRVFGYIISITLSIAIIFLNIILNNSEQNYIIQIIQIMISLIILYGPIELLIQYTKLKLAFTISEELRLDPFNPVINFIYYFLQDELVISLVKGAQIY